MQISIKNVFAGLGTAFIILLAVIIGFGLMNGMNNDDDMLGATTNGKL